MSKPYAMSIYHCASVLFLLIIAVAQASSGDLLGKKGDNTCSCSLEEVFQELVIREEYSMEPGSEDHTPTMLDLPVFELTSKSTLKEVNLILGTIRAVYYAGDPKLRSSEINDKILDMLKDIGYLENDLWSKVDEAIKENHYAFLKSLYPTTKWIWWICDDGLALLLAKAFGRTEWMSEKKWREYSKGIDWKLRFRSLIRSKNENVYMNDEFRKLIFNSRLVRHNSKKIIQEAYASKNFAFLSVLPYPSKERPLHLKEAVFYWSLMYGQPWCPKSWEGFMDKIERINETPDDFERFLFYDHMAFSTKRIDPVKEINEALDDLEVFNCDNPKVFNCKQVNRFLRKWCNGFKESLDIAVKFDSLSFAQYLRDKHGPKKFREMAAACTEIHIHRRLSRVYNLFLDSGMKLDANIIEFQDVLSLDEKHLEPLLKGGFSKSPPNWLDVSVQTKTGIEFLKRILRGEYRMDGKLSDLLQILARIDHLEILDVEAFKLIDKNLPCKCLQWKFRGNCAEIAIQRNDIKFLIGTDLLSDITYRISNAVFDQAAKKGNLATLDWILENKPELLTNETEWFLELPSRPSGTVCWKNAWFCNQPHQLPLLRHLFKKLPPCKFLAFYANIHLRQAWADKDEQHYSEVLNLDGVEEMLKGYEYKIPERPEKR